MKMSKKDQNLLLFLVGALVIVVVWFFVVSPMRQKTESLRMENSSLKGTAELYQSINMNKDEYEKSILVLEYKRDNILDDYPSNMLTTDKIMYLTNLENFYVEDVAVAGMAFNVVFDPLIGYFYKLVILGKPAAELVLAWNITTTGVNAILSVIVATIIYMALRPVLIKSDMFLKIGKE